jgi:hypothetical protein
LLPGHFEVFGEWYSLVATMYNGGGHFDTRVRKGELFYSHDGMQNDGCFVPLEVNSFRAMAGMRRVDSLLYVRDDMLAEPLD